MCFVERRSSGGMASLNCNIDARWCFVHATHMTGGEVADLAASGAIAHLSHHRGRSRRWDISGGGILRGGRSLRHRSDSHVIVDAAEELRLIEYGQRLSTRRRNLLARNAHASTGTSLYLDAVDGGAQALANVRRYCLVSLLTLSCWMGRRRPSRVKQVRISRTRLCFPAAGVLPSISIRGQKVISDGHHAKEERIAERYRQTMRRLLDA